MNKAVIIISKILEVVHWVGCGFMVALTIVFASGHIDLAKYLTDAGASTDDIEMYGLALSTESGGALSNGSLAIFFGSGILTMAILALIFRYVYLIFKTAEGKTKFAEGATPFQQPIIDMTRRIGFLCIALPAVQLVTSIIEGVAFGGNETSVEFTTVLFGLIVLCLSRFFSYGIELQKDTEGLV